MAAKGTILVVDNESDQLDMMKEILERSGFDAQTTDSPRQALDMVTKQSFSLIILDLIMPDVDGPELCEQIKQIQPDVRVYAYSGHAHLFRPERLKQSGFDGTINKPATLKEINSVLIRTSDAQPVS